MIIFIQSGRCSSILFATICFFYFGLQGSFVSVLFALRSWHGKKSYFLLVWIWIVYPNNYRDQLNSKSNTKREKKQYFILYRMRTQAHWVPYPDQNGIHFEAKSNNNDISTGKKQKRIEFHLLNIESFEWMCHVTVTVTIWNRCFVSFFSSFLI